MGADQSVCDICGVSKNVAERDATSKRVKTRGVPDFLEMQAQDSNNMVLRYVNNVPMLARLLAGRAANGFDINYTLPSTGDSALHLAAKLGNMLSCICLIEVLACRLPHVGRECEGARERAVHDANSQNALSWDPPEQTAVPHLVLLPTRPFQGPGSHSSNQHFTHSCTLSTRRVAER